MQATVLSVALIVYSLTLSLFAPAWFRFISNVALALFVIWVVRRAGLTNDEIGISERSWKRGLESGGRIGFVVAAAIIGASLLFTAEAAKQSAEGDVPDQLSGLLYEVLFRIPFETAAVEEILFRGAVFALWRKVHGTSVAFLGSSAAFALWHIGPSLADRDVPFALDGLLNDVGGPLLVTFALGFIYAALRLRLRGVVGPAMIHAAQNCSLLVAGYIALH